MLEDSETILDVAYSYAISAEMLFASAGMRAMHGLVKIVPPELLHMDFSVVTKFCRKLADACNYKRPRDDALQLLMASMKTFTSASVFKLMEFSLGQGWDFLWLTHKTLLASAYDNYKKATRWGEKRTPVPVVRPVAGPGITDTVTWGGDINKMSRFIAEFAKKYFGAIPDSFRDDLMVKMVRFADEVAETIKSPVARVAFRTILISSLDAYFSYKSSQMRLWIIETVRAVLQRKIDELSKTTKEDERIAEAVAETLKQLVDEVEKQR